MTTLYGVIDAIYFNYSLFGVTWYLNPERTIKFEKTGYFRHELIDRNVVNKDDIFNLNVGSYVEMQEAE